jgi:polynucleotide 5'-hydroxyl-kinase GRC3/NOL9
LQQTVEPDKTLLVDGPASVSIACGKVEVFGRKISVATRIVVRDGKRLPFFAIEKSIFEISLGAGASTQEVAGSTIPESWYRMVQAVLSIKQKPVTILVVGKTDSGKSSFCTYLVNKLVDEKSKVAVLDGDIGQSDIGPSGTVAFALTSKSVTELSELKFENAFFVGSTSPIRAIAKTIEGLALMKDEILKKLVDYVVVNTNGWVAGDIAVRIKTSVINELKPDVIVGVQIADDLGALIADLESQMTLIDPSPYLNERTAAERKSLREMTYARYLKDARLQCYPISQLSVEPKNFLPKSQEPEKGLLVGLYLDRKFLGIGVLREINSARRVLKVQTAVSSRPSRIVIGNVVLDQKLQEVQD